MSLGLSSADSFYTADSLINESQLHEAHEVLVYLATNYRNQQKLDSLALVLNMQGVVFAMLEDHEKAMEKFKDSESICKNEGYDLIHAKALLNIGNGFYSLDNLDSAMHFWEQSRLKYLNVRNAEGAVNVFLNMGIVLLESERYDECIAHYRSALNDSLVLNNAQFHAITKLNLGVAYLNTDQYDSSLYYFNEVMESVEPNTLDIKISTLQNLGHLYYNKEEYKTSNDYYEAYHELKDSLYNAEIGVMIQDLEYQFELEKEKLGLKEAELKAVKWQRAAIFIGMFVLLILTALFFWVRNKKQLDSARTEAMFQARESENKRIANLLWKEIGESSKEGKLLLSGQELPENTIPGAIAAARFLSNQQLNPFLAVSFKKAIEHLVDRMNKSGEFKIQATVEEVDIPMKPRAKHYQSIEKLLLFVSQSRAVSVIDISISSSKDAWQMKLKTDGQLDDKDALWPLAKALIKRIDGKVKIQHQEDHHQIVAKANF